MKKIKKYKNIIKIAWTNRCRRSDKSNRNNRKLFRKSNTRSNNRKTKNEKLYTRLGTIMGMTVVIILA